MNIYTYLCEYVLIVFVFHIIFIIFQAPGLIKEKHECTEIKFKKNQNNNNNNEK